MEIHVQENDSGFLPSPMNQRPESKSQSYEAQRREQSCEFLQAWIRLWCPGCDPEVAKMEVTAVRTLLWGWGSLWKGRLCGDLTVRRRAGERLALDARVVPPRHPGVMQSHRPSLQTGPAVYALLRWDRAEVPHAEPISQVLI